MKKVILIFITLFSIGLCSQASPASYPTPEPQSSRGITFRSTQKLRSSLGFELYLYSDHSMECYDDEGRRLGSGTWKLEGGELYLYNSHGRLMSKCNCKIYGGELSWVDFDGDRYYKKR